MAGVRARCAGRAVVISSGHRDLERWQAAHDAVRGMPGVAGTEAGRAFLSGGADQGSTRARSAAVVTLFARSAAVVTRGLRLNPLLQRFPQALPPRRGVEQPLLQPLEQGFGQRPRELAVLLRFGQRPRELARLLRVGR